MADLRGISVRLVSPPTPDGAAIAVISLSAPDPDRLDEALRDLGLAGPAPGAVALQDLLGIDEGLVIRWSPVLAHLTPHGGPRIVEQLMQGLLTRGATVESRAERKDEFVEAVDLIEACALDCITRAASPRALDTVLHQRDVWRREVSFPGAETQVSASAHRCLDRLLRPVNVVLTGAPNIGKSSLVNALAGRDISVVADEPGVTRDHVGVLVELDGVTVRLVDTPGLGPSATDSLEQAAAEMATRALAGADLWLLCADATSAFPDLSTIGLAHPPPVMKVGLRADLGVVSDAELAVSLARPESLADLAVSVRRRLVPDCVLETPDLWRFHPDLPALPPGG